jgi:WD40 repeat protein
MPLTRILLPSLLATASALSLAQPENHTLATKPNAVWLSSPASIGTLALAAAPKRVVAACSDSQLRIWDFGDGSLKQTIRLTNPHIDVLAISPDAHWIFTGDHAGSATVWDAETGSVHLRVQLPHYPGTAIFSRDSKLLAIAIMGGPTQIFDLTTAGKLSEANPAMGTAAIAFSRDGSLFADADADTAVRIYETRTGKLIVENHDFVLEPMAIDFTPDGKQVIAAGADQMLAYIDAATGKLIRNSKKLQHPVIYLETSPNGESLAAVLMKAENMTQPAPIAVWALPSGAERSQWMPPDLAYAANWTPDGHLIAASLAGNRIAIWQIQ